MSTSPWPWGKVAIVRDIAEKYRTQKMSMRAIARDYGVTRNAIGRVLHAVDVEARSLVKTGHNIPHAVGLLEVNLGRQFRKVRQEKGIGLHEFARLMARGINLIRWHESGARMMRLGDIVRAAAILKVEPSTLCKQAPPAVPKPKKARP